MMIVVVAFHFGGNFASESWKIITKVIYYISQWMYLHTKYQKNFNQEAIKLFNLHKTNNRNYKCTIVSNLDKFNTPVTDSTAITKKELIPIVFHVFFQI